MTFLTFFYGESCKKGKNSGEKISPFKDCLIFFFFFRLCIFHNKRSSAFRHPGNEWFPDRHKETQGSAEETQGGWKALLAWKYIL